ncbi:hypothetical protein [Fischerella thermalis]|uniref:hypothetical protein n=1 Tax=Fischerella thermalis TaxID=372787 RepID=UPI0015E0E8C1|nr:hypothetical protein [Fischerella thermalis]
MIISDLNHIEAVESHQVIGGGCCKYDDCNGYGKKKGRNIAIATAVAVAGDRKFYKNDD